MAWVVAVTIAVLVWLGAGPAQATSAGNMTIKNWGKMDECARQAQAAFPDYSAEAYAKRDARLKECLAAKNLPPRAPIAPGN
jgi:hypothetical protein